MEARRATSNLRKTICFSLSSTMAKICAFIYSVLLGAPLPLGTILMLTLSTFSDLLIAIGFAREELEGIEKI